MAAVLESSEQTAPKLEDREPFAPTVRRGWHRGLKTPPRAAELSDALELLKARKRPFGELGPSTLSEALDALRGGTIRPPSQLVLWA